MVKRSANMPSNLASVLSTGSNCKFCAYPCYKVALAHWDEIQAWRDRTANLTKVEVDIELEWIFGRVGLDQTKVRTTEVLEDLSEETERSPSPGSLGDTSTSDSGPGLHSSCTWVETKNKHVPASTKPSLPDSANENTSTSDADDVLVIQEVAPTKQRAAQQKPRQPYRKRKATKAPSVLLQGVICKERVIICRPAALKVLGIGPGRLNRVTLLACIAHST